MATLWGGKTLRDDSDVAKKQRRPAWKIVKLQILRQRGNIFRVQSEGSEIAPAHVDTRSGIPVFWRRDFLEFVVKRPSLLKRLYLKHLAKPATERPLFCAIANGSVRQIVEIGIGDCSRALRLIRLSMQCHGQAMTYCGIDQFEAAKGKAAIKYKDAHCKLNVANCKVKLVPGEPSIAIASCANSFTNSDLIIVSNQFEANALASMWMYIPRMLSEHAHLYMQAADGTFQAASRQKIQVLADQAAELRRKSA
jgi:hypothetical protein